MMRQMLKKKCAKGDGRREEVFYYQSNLFFWNLSKWKIKKKLQICEEVVLRWHDFSL